MSDLNGPDQELEAVAAEIRRLDPKGLRTAQVLRNTLDQLYDGQRTGRYRWDELYKTEKTHCGTLVEINLHREFKFKDGVILDYTIAGADVDCKYSQKLFGWMIPPEALNYLCLVVSAEDQASKWSMGVVRANVELLSSGANRDKKTTFNPAGRDAITWIFKDHSLPPNVLLQLDRAKVDKLMAIKSGQKRVDELFRCALGMRVGRAVVATVAQQDDYMKRVRENGGARTNLQPYGIVILGQYLSHCAIARALGIEEPGPGESIAVRLAPAAPGEKDSAIIDSRSWKIAKASDTVVTAPKLPRLERMRATTTSRRRAERS